MKKFLLLTLIMCLFGGLSSSLMAQEIQIGEGTGSTTNGQYIPIFIGNSNKYSISQQIYFADEINMPDGGTITQISFYTYNNKWTRNIEIYMTHTSKTTFTTNANWESVSASNKVFSGEVEFGSGNTSDIVWVTITLDKGFSYDGKSNLLLCVNDLTGTTTGDSNYSKFRTNSVSKSNTVIYKYGTQITDPSTQLSGLNASSRKAYRNIIKLNFGGSDTPVAPGEPTLYLPYNGSTVFNPALTIDKLGSNTTHYQILMGESENNLTPVTEWIAAEDLAPYQTDNLESGKTYYWQVIARNDEDSDALTTSSEKRSFTAETITAKPEEIEVISPENGATCLFNPSLEWNFSTYTEDYQLLIDGNIIIDWTNRGYGINSGSHQTSGLSSGEHTWQVNARNSAGTTEGTVYTFSVPTLPDNVTVIYPTDGATVTSKKIKWQFAPNTKEYRFLYGESIGSLACN